MASEYVESGFVLRSLNIRPFRINALDIKFISREFHEHIEVGASAWRRCGGSHRGTRHRRGHPRVAARSELLRRCDRSPSSRTRPAVSGVSGQRRVAEGFVNSRTVGAVQQHFNVGAARELPVPDLALEEQRRIAASSAPSMTSSTPTLHLCSSAQRRSDIYTAG